MKRILLVSILGCFILAGIAAAEVFKVDHIKLGAGGTVTKEKSTGDFFRKSRSEIKKYEYQGQTFVQKVEDEMGAFDKTKEYQTAHEVAYYILQGDRLVPYQVESVQKNKAGEVTSKTEKLYDSKNKKVLVRKNGKEKVFDLKDDMIGTEFLFIALGNYPFDSKRDFKFHLLTGEPTLYPITMKYRGEETIAVDGKEYDCHKIEMIPDLGLLNIVGAFVPKTYFWYTRSAPHQWIRYEGLDGGLGDPYIVREAVN